MHRSRPAPQMLAGWVCAGSDGRRALHGIEPICRAPPIAGAVRRAIATCREKTANSFMGVRCLTAVLDWFKEQQTLS
ncbi:hypothetical protein CHT98_23415 (plasmid) [Azospirillum brasilense]|uniref:Uncharacterized protein n=1 Tax=Azospirillum brasilense TaxID=192 RepID=A0A235H8A1_AZOBR|nr:hypothetical protein CHT98_23415 [Azospirillum brasilense]